MHLGGKDFYNRIVDFCLQDFAKRTLFSATQAMFVIESLLEGTGYSCSLSRARFEELYMDYFRNSTGPAVKCLRDSGIESNVHEVVLVGGSTRIPMVQSMIQEFFYAGVALSFV